MTEASESLAKLRREIDRIDDALHDLLMRRIEVAQRIRGAKGGPVAIRPGREAAVLRRLLARHAGSLPKAVLVRIWREIFAASLAQQEAFVVTLQSRQGEGSLAGIAREHFGVLTPMTEESSAVRVITAVAEGTASVGIVAPAEADSPDPWWRYLARRGPQVPRIVAKLPFAPTASPAAGGQSALVVALAALEETGRDRAILVVETREEVSRSAFKEWLARSGLSARETAIWQDGPGLWLHYAEVEGFLSETDARLIALDRIAGERLADRWVIGAYALPLSEQELAGESDLAAAREAG